MYYSTIPGPDGHVPDVSFWRTDAEKGNPVYMWRGIREKSMAATLCISLCLSLDAYSIAWYETTTGGSPGTYFSSFTRIG